MTHQHKSWNVSIKSSTEFTILPKEENAKEEHEQKKKKEMEEVKEELSNILF